MRCISTNCVKLTMNKSLMQQHPKLKMFDRAIFSMLGYYNCFETTHLYSLLHEQHMEDITTVDSQQNCSPSPFWSNVLAKLCQYIHKISCLVVKPVAQELMSLFENFQVVMPGVSVLIYCFVEIQHLHHPPICAVFLCSISLSAVCHNDIASS
jgi:hypothetical protein